MLLDELFLNRNNISKGGKDISIEDSKHIYFL